MEVSRVWWIVGIFAVTASACLAQAPSAHKTAPPPAKKSPAAAKSKQPEWKTLVQQASEAERKGNLQKARSLLDKAYRTAPAGENKAQVAFQIASTCEKQKAYDEARRWYLQSIYDAPKGPLAPQARQRMRSIPDSRRPAAAGATAAGGAPGGAKPK
ncbi:hypothetical protein HRbin16_00586 [bacterium HR16]|nr:hypothetical protein HRbin16_00586 [bacterium HR16]